MEKHCIEYPQPFTIMAKKIYHSSTEQNIYFCGLQIIHKVLESKILGPLRYISLTWDMALEYSYFQKSSVFWCYAAVRFSYKGIWFI